MPAKLIVGLLFRDFDVQLQALESLSGRFGPLDFLSDPRPFSYTSYYEKEMGAELYRQTGSFVELVRPETLPDIKLFTNDVESRLSADGKRRVNIDPGLLSEERLILATGKNYTHRIYMRDGIYADLTLMYQDGAYRAFPWTYPDYSDATLLGYLDALRNTLRFQRSGKLPRRG
ncbi:MAG: DUF4416 family protein [Desulfobacteraceae bacterium]|nr:DUF4416 family protein [Desulfobacteraceae bacterium]